MTILHEILTEKLEMLKLCTKIVPKLLTPKQQARRISWKQRGYHWWRVLSKREMEASRGTENKKSLENQVQCEDNMDRFLWFSRHCLPEICSSQPENERIFLRWSFETPQSSCGSSSTGFGTRGHVDPSSCAGSQVPRYEGVFGPKRNHRDRTLTLFTRFSPLRLLLLPKIQDGASGATFHTKRQRRERHKDINFPK